LFLRFTGVFQLRLCDLEGMVAGVNDVKKVGRFHFLPDVLEQIEWAERIARSLHEQDWRPEIAQHFIPQPLWIAGATKRIPEANQTGDRFFESKVATNPAAHAFPDQKHGLRLILSSVA
jgi:hypothetical protein